MSFVCSFCNVFSFTMDINEVADSEIVALDMEGDGVDIGCSQDGVVNTVTEEKVTLPWPALRKYFTQLKEKNSLNLSGVCVFCKKTYSCAKSSASNFEKHLVSTIL